MDFQLVPSAQARAWMGCASARTASWLVAAIGATLRSDGLDIPGPTRPLQADSFAHVALNTDPERAGSAGATKATVPARVLREALLMAACLDWAVGCEWREVCKALGDDDNVVFSSDRGGLWRAG